MNAARGLVLVRRVATEETLPGGRILLPETTRAELAACQVEIVDVGQDALCEDYVECSRPHTEGEDHRGRRVGFHPMPGAVRAGAWALIRQRALLDVGQDDVWACGQDDLLAILEP